MILLDTNVWSEQPKPQPDLAIARWTANHMDEIWLSVIVIAEIQMGIDNPAATAKRAKLTNWLADLKILYADRILAFDTASAHIFGSLIARKKLQNQETKLLDLQLAAQALAHDCPLATRNVRDFEWTGVTLINPWD